MQEKKLKDKLNYFIRKINNETFDSASLNDFFSTIRWIENRDTMMFEISNFVAHQEKDRGIIVDKLKCWGVISDFIEAEKLNETKNIIMDSFPPQVFESISLLYGQKIEKYYKKDRAGNYRFKNKGKNQVVVKKILERVFFEVNFVEPLITQRDIYADFVSTLNYLSGKYDLIKLEKMGSNKQNDLILCILSILIQSKIQVAKDIVISPYLRVNEKNEITVVYENKVRFPSVGVQCINDSSLVMLFIDFKVDKEDVEFIENGSVLERNSDNNLVFAC